MEWCNSDWALATLPRSISKACRPIIVRGLLIPYFIPCLCSRIFYRPTNSTFLLHIILNLLGWGLGGVGVGRVNVRLHLRHEVDATSRMGLGLGGVGWGGACLRSLALASWSWCYVTDGVGAGWGGVGHVNVRLHLRHEVDATLRMGLWLGGVGWGMSTFACTCVMKLMLRYAWGWGWVGWGGACQRSLALASWSWCYVTDGVGVGWGGVGHVNVRLHLRQIHTGGIDSCWTILKAGVPDKIASKCGSKTNPLLWKYIRSAQWRWEMNSADLLAKRASTWQSCELKKGKPNSERFWPQNAGRVDESILRWTFFKKLFWTQYVRLPSTRTMFLRNHGTVKDPSGCLCIPDLLMTRETTLPTLQYCLHAISLRTNIPSGNQMWEWEILINSACVQKEDDRTFDGLIMDLPLPCLIAGGRTYYNVILLVGGDWNMAFMTFPIILGMSSSQLTNSIIFPKSACEGFFVKKQPLYYIFTPSHLLIYIFTPSHLLIYIFTPSHLLI